MDWKSIIKWLAGVLLAFLAGRLLDNVEILVSVVTNQAPLPQGIDIALGIIGIGAIVVAVGLAIHGIWDFSQRKKYDQFYAILFFPRDISYKRGERTPRNKELHFKYFVDGRTDNAFFITEYGNNLLLKGKIQWYSETDQGEEKNKQFLTRKGIRLIPKPVSETILKNPLRETEFDPRYKNVEVKLFYSKLHSWPLLSSIFKRGLDNISSQRLVVSLDKKKCCSFPDQDIYLIRKGKIPFNSVFSNLWKRHVQEEWIRKNNLIYVDKQNWQEELL